MSTVNDAVEDGVAESRLAEHLWMPQRLTDESLRYGWSIHTTRYTVSAFQSATDARDGDRG